MKGLMIWSVLILGLISVFIGCTQKFVPKDDAERAIMTYYEKNAAGERISKIERLDDETGPADNASTVRYMVTFESTSDSGIEPIAIIEYNPSTGEITEEST